MILCVPFLVILKDSAVPTCPGFQIAVNVEASTGTVGGARGEVGEGYKAKAATRGEEKAIQAQSGEGGLVDS